MAYKSSSRNKWYGRSRTSHSGRNRRIKVLPQEVSQRKVAGRPLGALEALKEELVNVNVSWLKYQIGLQQHFNHWSNATSYSVHTLYRTGGHPMPTQTNWGTASTCTLSLCFRDILSTLLMLTYTLSTLKICGCAKRKLRRQFGTSPALFPSYLHKFVFRNRFRGQDMFHIILKTIAENYPLAFSDCFGYFCTTYVFLWSFSIFLSWILVQNNLGV